MRNVAGLTLTTASLFLAVVAALIQAPSLFYMGTALFALIGGCNLQAWLAVRGLKLERIAPPTARIGELVTVEFLVSSDLKIRRPLISVEDRLPARLRVTEITPSLPVAPAYDRPVRTQYQLRAARRGRYRWSGVTVISNDALGLVIKRRDYETETTTITVLPQPIPISVELPNAGGWGISEAESGQSRGVGIEPRGVRGYTEGDSLRHIHWASSARSGNLLVKEFEAGTHASARLYFQLKEGSDVGPGPVSSLDLMCGHALYLAEILLRQGSPVDIPGHMPPGVGQAKGASAAIAEALAGLADSQSTDLSDDLARSQAVSGPGGVVLLFLSRVDSGLPQQIRLLSERGHRVLALVYDADAFVTRTITRGLKTPLAPSAAQPAYLDQLMAAGAQIEVVTPSGGPA